MSESSGLAEVVPFLAAVPSGAAAGAGCLDRAAAGARAELERVMEVEFEFLGLSAERLGDDAAASDGADVDDALGSLELALGELRNVERIVEVRQLRREVRELRQENQELRGDADGAGL